MHWEETKEIILENQRAYDNEHKSVKTCIWKKTKVKFYKTKEFMTINRLKKDYKSDQQLYRDENKEKI